MMMRCSLLFLSLSVVACTDGHEEIEPLVTADTQALHFRQQNGELRLDYVLDVQTAQLSGFHVEVRADNQLCRHTSPAKTIASPDALMTALDGSQLSTLTGGLCEKVAAGCGGPDTFLGVDVNGRYFTTQPSMCNTLVEDANLEPSLHDAFEGLAPTLERVEYDGTTDTYRAVGPCS